MEVVRAAGVKGEGVKEMEPRVGAVKATWVVLGGDGGVVRGGAVKGAAVMVAVVRAPAARAAEATEAQPVGVGEREAAQRTPPRTRSRPPLGRESAMCRDCTKAGPPPPPP